LAALLPFPSRLVDRFPFAILGSMVRSFPCSVGILRAIRVPADFAGPALLPFVSRFISRFPFAL
jgi:hypothetical protein